MKKFQCPNKIKQLSHWIWQGRFYIFTLIGLFVTIMCCTKLWEDYHPRLISGVMTLIGLAIILWQQLVDARTYENFEPNTIRHWIKSYPRKKTYILTAESGEYKLIPGNVNSKVSIRKNATIEEKIDFLLRTVDRMQDIDNHIANQIKEGDEKLTRRIEGVETGQKELKASFLDVVAGHLVGDYDKNFCGIWLAIFGTIIQFFY